MQQANPSTAIYCHGYNLGDAEYRKVEERETGDSVLGRGLASELPDWPDAICELLSPRYDANSLLSKATKYCHAALEAPSSYYASWPGLRHIMGACLSHRSGPNSSRGKAAKYQHSEIDSSSRRRSCDFGLGGLYDVVELLGHGISGETWLCADVATGERVAVKLMRRPVVKPMVGNVVREITIQHALGQGHLHIIRSREVVLTPTHLAIVMEYASGGSLVDYVSDRCTGRAARGGLFVTEDDTAFIFRQIVNAVDFCHRNCVVHRDLKLENTLLTGQSLPMVKLCDFGFAKCWLSGSSTNMVTYAGTSVYMAPQVRA